MSRARPPWVTLNVDGAAIEPNPTRGLDKSCYDDLDGADRVKSGLYRLTFQELQKNITCVFTKEEG